MSDGPGSIYRFGRFEFDAKRERLRRSGMLVRLAPQPCKLLGLLIRRGGDVVTREEIREHLWPEGTHVDFEQGINHSVRRIRRVLGDDAGSARFIETLPRIGYRFFGGVERVSSNGDAAAAATRAAKPQLDRLPAVPGAGRRSAVGTALIATSIATLLLLVALSAPHMISSAEAPGPPLFDNMRLEQVTRQGSVFSAAMAPDGRSIAYALHEDGGFGVRLRGLGSGDDVRIVEPQATPIVALSFARDGNHLYFTRRAALGPGYASLYRVSITGGSPTELIFDVDSGVAVDPEGQRVAYVRGIPDRHEGALFVASGDGRDERRVATWAAPDHLLPVAPAWSPDGQRLAVAIRGLGRSTVDIVEVAVAGSRPRTIGETRWNRVDGLQWNADGSGLLITAEHGLDDRGQIWRMDYPSGALRRISNDLSSYLGLSASADGAALVSIQRDREVALWTYGVVDDFDGTDRRWWATDQVPLELTGMVRRGSAGGVLFNAVHEGRRGLWRMGARGERPQPVIPAADLEVGRISASSDGEVAVYDARAADGVPHLWQVSTRGGVPRQLTDGAGEASPALCADGRVLFTRPGLDGIWVVTPDRPVSLKLSDLTPYSVAALCSPDGTRIAFDANILDAGRYQRVLVVLPSTGGDPLVRVPWADGEALAWHPDGTTLTYTTGSTSGGSTLWKLPLTSGVAERLRGLPAGRVASFDWAPDGRSIRATRLTTRNDAVLVSEMR